MGGIYWLLLLLDLVGSAALFSVSYLSLRALRSGLRVFSLFFLGFAALAAGRLCHGLVLVALALTRPPGILVAIASTTAGLVVLGSQLVAYALIAVGYSRQARGGGAIGVSAYASYIARRVSLQVIGQVLCMALLLYVVLQALAVYLEERKRICLLPLLGFSALLASHAVELLALLEVSEGLYVISGIAYFGGLVPFLILALEVAQTT